MARERHQRATTPRSPRNAFAHPCAGETFESPLSYGIASGFAETTALGAAYAAGIATGFFSDLDQLSALWAEDRRWQPSMAEEQRETLYASWKKAVERTFDWVD